MKKKVFFTIGAKQENNFMIVKVLDIGRVGCIEQLILCCDGICIKRQVA